MIKWRVFTVGVGNSLRRFKWLFQILLVLICVCIHTYFRTDIQMSDQTNRTFCQYFEAWIWFKARRCHVVVQRSVRWCKVVKSSRWLSCGVTSKVRWSSGKVVSGFQGKSVRWYKIVRWSGGCRVVTGKIVSAGCTGRVYQMVQIARFVNSSACGIKTIRHYLTPPDNYFGIAYHPTSFSPPNNRWLYRT